MKEFIYGLLGFVGLLVLYTVVMGFASKSIQVTINQFIDIWYWAVVLAVGFGIQVGLFTHLRKRIRQTSITTHSTAVTATSTGTSAVGMIACCAHHLTEIAPIIGLSGLSIFLTRYQIPIIVLGIITNGIGIWYMVGMIKKVG